MPNYTLKYGVSEIAEILNVDKNLIKTWTFHFSEYLNKKASPKKGIQREYTNNDINVLSYISYSWEEEPDIESIKIGLNCNYHLDSPFNEVAKEAIPIFRELSESEYLENIFVAGGLIGGIGKLELADSYKKAGDLLVDNLINQDNNWGIFFPIIFTYRHSTELYLKAILKQENNTHDLTILSEKFNQTLIDKLNIQPPKWFDNIIKSFNEFDPGSTTFRYGNLDWKDEMVIDLKHIKNVMEWSSESFHRIYENLKIKTQDYLNENRLNYNISSFLNNNLL
ncbi:MerR family transcriptional regulator [uncultured Draconibacterium sp.]|uniref:MerR family transcriptional regulator n=1 Tax=uncultured Draconibacterium sp. TaxID=1573823 RepID=UPI002AA92915|nr:MerR family transcriptional regulator [uncultured Draconibacterium sp.]